MRLFILFILLGITIVGVIHEKGLLKVNQVEVVIDDPKLNTSPYWGNLLGKVKPQLKEFENKNFWQVPLVQVASKFQNESWVKNISISRDWPQKIKINIESKAIKIILISPDGKLYPVDSE